MILARTHWVCANQQTMRRVTATPVNSRLDSACPGKHGVFLGVLHKVSCLSPVRWPWSGLAIGSAMALKRGFFGGGVQQHFTVCVTVYKKEQHCQSVDIGPLSTGQTFLGRFYSFQTMERCLPVPPALLPCSRRAAQLELCSCCS